MINNNINKIKFFLIFISSICLIVQLFLINNLNDLTCLLIVFFTNLIFIKYCLNSNIYFNSPLSYLIILFSSFYNLGFSLFLKTIELKPLTDNLEYPLEIFIFISLFNISTIILHKLYLSFIPKTYLFKNIQTKIKNTEVFNYNKKNFILFSILSIILTINVFNYNLNIVTEQPIIVDIWNGFKFLILSPVIIYYYQNHNKLKYFIVIIIIYLIISFGLNSMSAFYDVLLLLLILFLFDFSIDKVNLNKKNSLLIILLLILIPNIFNFFNNFTYIYYQERQNREGKNFQERANSFMNALKNYGKYNEIYVLEKRNSDVIFVENYYEKFIFLNRINPIKIHDNYFLIKNTLSKSELIQIQEYEKNKIISILPSPIIKIFDSEFNKNNFKISIASFSYGIIDKKVINPNYIGSFAVSSYIYFGFFYLVFLLPFSFCIFMFSDFFSNNRNKLSPLLIFILFSTSGGLISSFAFSEISKFLFFIIRTIPQTVIFLYILNKILKKF